MAIKTINLTIGAGNELSYLFGTGNWTNFSETKLLSETPKGYFEFCCLTLVLVF